MKKYIVLFTKNFLLQIFTFAFLLWMVYAAGTLITNFQQNVSEGDIITSSWYNSINTMLKWPHTDWGICAYVDGKIMCNNTSTPDTTLPPSSSWTTPSPLLVTHVLSDNFNKWYTQEQIKIWAEHWNRLLDEVVTKANGWPITQGMNNCKVSTTTGGFKSWIWRNEIDYCISHLCDRVVGDYSIANNINAMAASSEWFHCSSWSEWCPASRFKFSCIFNILN